MYHLKFKATRLKSDELFCSLVFDEIVLEPAIAYNIKEDVVYGFENFG